MSVERKLAVNCDWFTLTAQSVPDRLLLERQWLHIRNDLVQLREPIKRMKFGGYEGEGTKFVSYGHRNDSDILIARGSWADVLLTEEMQSLPRCTRVDFAVTVDMGKECPWVLGDALRITQGGVRVKNNLYYPVHTINFEGGQTLYLGSRRGYRLLRLYDKGAREGTHPESNLWRYEVQFNQELADKAFRRLLQNLQNRTDLVKSEVARNFSDFGIKTVFVDPGFTCNAMEVSIVKYDPGKTLHWLSSSVVPAIYKLMDAGYEEEVRRILTAAIQTVIPLEV